MTLTTGRQGTGYPLSGTPYGRRVQGTEKWQHPEPRTQNPERGITLIEVLLAVVVLSVGLVGVLRAYAASIGALEITRETVSTVELLKEKMAEIEQGAIEQGGISAGSTSGQFTGKFEDYSWAQEATTSTSEGLCELALTVTRVDGSRQVSLVTYAQNKDYEK